MFFFVLWELDQQPLRIKKKANDSDFFARPPLRKNVAQKKKRRKNGRAIFPIPVCVCVCCCCRIASLTGPRVRNVSTRHWNAIETRPLFFPSSLFPLIFFAAPDPRFRNRYLKKKGKMDRNVPTPTENAAENFKNMRLFNISLKFLANPARQRKTGKTH